MTFIISQNSKFNFWKMKIHGIITKVTIIQTKMVDNFRKKVENFDPKIFRLKDSKIELKLYFELKFVMLSSFCFIHVNALIPGYFLKFQKWPKNTENQNFVLDELYFQKLEYNPIFVGFGWKVDGWKGRLVKSKSCDFAFIFTK